jgi:hypothetical protein
LLFDDVPIIELPADCSGDGTVDTADLACAVASGVLSEVLAATGIVPGDLDANGEVAFADFLTLADNFGGTGVGYPKGDVDGNGEVAFADFLVIAENFGKKSIAAAAVPEPTGHTLLLTAILGFSLVRRRRGFAVAQFSAARRRL